MKYSFFLIAALAAFFLLGMSSDARDYKVLYVSSIDAVVFNGRALCVGDVIPDNANLNWKDDRQVIKVADVETQKQYIICAMSAADKKAFSLSDYFFLKKPLASRTGVFNTLQDLSSFFQGEVVIDDSLSIPTLISQNETHFFYLSCEFLEGTVNKAIKPADGALVICVEDLFMVDGMPTDPVVTNASLFYYDAENEISTCVSSCFFIVPVLELQNRE